MVEAVWVETSRGAVKSSGTEAVSFASVPFAVATKAVIASVVSGVAALSSDWW